MLFPVQILVIRELSKEEIVWLRSGLELQEDIEVLAKAYKGKEKPQSGYMINLQEQQR